MKSDLALNITMFKTCYENIANFNYKKLSSIIHGCWSVYQLSICNLMLGYPLMKQLISTTSIAAFGN
jgi:hypothetical protein